MGDNVIYSLRVSSRPRRQRHGLRRSNDMNANEKLIDHFHGRPSARRVTDPVNSPSHRLERTVRCRHGHIRTGCDDCQRPAVGAARREPG